MNTPHFSSTSRNAAWRIFLFALLTATTTSFAAPPPILLANVLSQQVDVTQYLVSEKYDGVRAIWDGKMLRFRSGRTVAAPAWFIAKLPPEALDGELWLARGRFDELSGIVRKAVPVDAEWRRVNYMIFELPQPEGAAPVAFSERAIRIKALVGHADFPALKAVDQHA